jgi:hypothetical protein
MRIHKYHVLIVIISVVSVWLTLASVGRLVQITGKAVPLAIYSGGSDIAIVFSRLDGVLQGRDIAFLYRQDGLQWHGYYLAHESKAWHDVTLEPFEATQIRICCKKKVVAVFDLETYEFTHIIQGISYSRKDGLEGGSLASKWGILQTSN